MSYQASTTLSRESLIDVMANTREEKEKHNDIEGTLKEGLKAREKKKQGQYAPALWVFTWLPCLSRHFRLCPRIEAGISLHGLSDPGTQKRKRCHDEVMCGTCWRQLGVRPTMPSGDCKDDIRRAWPVKSGGQGSFWVEIMAARRRSVK